MNFKKKKPLKILRKNNGKNILLKAYMHFFEGRGRILDAFENIFPRNKTEGTEFSDLAMQDKLSDCSNLKVVTPKQMLKNC